MLAIEKENTRLKGVLPREYGRPGLNKERLGELIDLISKVDLIAQGDSEAPASCESPADATHRSLDLLGRIYEYFLAKFAGAEGKSGGEFYTPRSVVRLLVEMIEPYEGRIYDPCCGSGGMFVQSDEFVKHHGGRVRDVAIFGQESNHTTWRLAKMNLAIRGIEANLGVENADTFSRDLHPDLKADYILANPPFNMSFWGSDKLAGDVRWKFGDPPTGNANYAWIQHMIHHLAQSGIAGFVLSNGSMSTNASGEGEIRRRIVEADIVDCMIALPPQLFYGAAIPACLWFVTRDKSGIGRGRRERRGQTLFIDSRKLGHLEDRTHRVLSAEDVARIATTYHSWRGSHGRESYQDVPGFCAGATIELIRSNGFVLTPGRYVGADEVAGSAEPFSCKLRRLTAELDAQFTESARLEVAIKARIAGSCRS
jgi:type I restriction enzyme M protein